MTLALVAGEGDLPKLIAGALQKQGRAFHICEVDGFVSIIADDPILFRLETLGSFIAELTDSDVQTICFAGRVPRPELDPSRIDAATMPMVPRIMSALQQGDDAALRGLLGFFEEAGISVVAAHDIVPNLLPDAGAVGAMTPSDAQIADINRGFDIIGAMAQVDVGQACVVSGGQALAVETMGGTDWMLRSLQRDPLPRGPGVLVKASKPGQDRRIDLPAIGPETLAQVAKTGLTGIALEQGGVMVLDMDQCRADADRLGLFLWVQP